MAKGLVRDELLAVKLNMQDDSRFALAEFSWDGIDREFRFSMFFYSLISPSHYRRVKLELPASLHNRDACPFKWNNIHTAQWICTPSFHKIIIIMAEGLVWDELLAVTLNMQDEPMPSCLLQINLESSFFTLLVLPPFGLPPCLPTPIANFWHFGFSRWF